MTAVRTAFAFVAAAVFLGPLAACGDSPFDLRWTERPDTVLLYSLARPELNLVSAFDFVPSRRRTVEVEAPGATGSWDVALDTRGGELVFLPPGALGIESRAGVASFRGLNLDELEEAPSDSASYSLETPVPVEDGTAYVIRTRRVRGSLGRLCSYYAEVVPVDINPDVGTVRLVYDVNPNCNDRSLVPDVAAD